MVYIFYLTNLPFVPIEPFDTLNIECILGFRIQIFIANKSSSSLKLKSTILYTYKVFIRPILEYGSILFAHSDTSLLKKIQAIETKAIKIAFGLPQWTTNHWCYHQVNFDKILDRIKQLGKRFIQINEEDPLIKPLIKSAKPSMMGYHSPVYKILNW